MDAVCFSWSNGLCFVWYPVFLFTSRICTIIYLYIYSFIFCQKVRGHGNDDSSVVCLQLVWAQPKNKGSRYIFSYTSDLLELWLEYLIRSVPGRLSPGSTAHEPIGPAK